MSDFERVYYHTEHTNCYTYFKIVGDFDPDAVTVILGIEPELQWKIGDKRRNGTIYDFALWQFGTCDEYNVLVENQMMKTIARLIPKTEQLREIKQKYDVSFILEIVPTVRFDENAPCLAPSKEVIKFCYETDTDIDIDLYVSCPDDFDSGVIF